MNFNLKASMDCDVKNFIYILEYVGCTKYYIEETNNFRLRTNLHRDHIRNNAGLAVNKHIYNCTKNSVDQQKIFRIMPFYKMNSDSFDLRRRKEEYFIEKYKPDLNDLHQ